MSCPFAHVGEGAARWGNPLVEASRAEGVSRSESEPDSASKHDSQAANLPKVAKPDTGGEATGKCSCRAWRGDWGQRAPNDRSRNLGGPASWVAPKARRENISAVAGASGVGGAHSSGEAG